MTTPSIALLGRKDEPTDAVEEYGGNLAAGSPTTLNWKSAAWFGRFTAGRTRFMPCGFTPPDGAITEYWFDRRRLRGPHVASRKR